MSNLKAPIRLALLDCNAPREKNGIYTELQLQTYRNKAAQLSARREIRLSVFKPEGEGRMPDLKCFDALVLPDSSYTPTREFMENTELGRMLPEFISKVIESGKLSLCICFGMEAVAASFGNYPASHLQSGTGKVFNLGYNTVRLEQAARRDLLFTDYQDQTKAIFAHRYFVERLPEGATLLAKTVLVPLAAFRMGSAYCVQWQPDLDLDALVKSADEHRGSGVAGKAAYEPMLNTYNITSRHLPEYDTQNSQVLDLFLKKISE